MSASRRGLGPKTVYPRIGARVRLLCMVAAGCRWLGAEHPRSPHARAPRAKVSDRRLECPCPPFRDLSRFQRIVCGSDQGLCATAITLQGVSLRRFSVFEQLLSSRYGAWPKVCVGRRVRQPDAPQKGGEKGVPKARRFFGSITLYNPQGTRGVRELAPFVHRWLVWGGV